MLERGVERIGQEAERGQRKRPGAARGIADRQVEDPLGQVGCPAGRRRIHVGVAVRAGRRVVGERAQCALHRRHRKAGAGVEAARALARAAPADEVPLAGEDDTGDELSRLGGEAGLEREPSLGGLAASGLLEQTRRLRRAARPRLGARAVPLPLVGRNRGVFRRAVMGQPRVFGVGEQRLVFRRRGVRGVLFGLGGVGRRCLFLRQIVRGG